MSILDKINKSSRDFLLNGKLKNDYNNNEITHDKLYLNKFLNSDSVDKEMKKKVFIFYSGFFNKPHPINLPSSTFDILKNKSNRNLNVKNNSYTKNIYKTSNSNNSTNVNLNIKRKLLFDYIKKSSRNKPINNNFIMRRMNRNFSNNSINFVNEENEKNSFKLLKNKVFGKGESFLERNITRDNINKYVNKKRSFSQISSTRNDNNNNNNNLALNNIKMRFNFY